MLNLIWLIPIAFVLSYLVNYFSDIMPLGKGLEKYKCTKCAYEYSLGEYLTFAKCKNCNQKITARHWIFMLLSMIFVVVVIIFPPLKSVQFHGFEYYYLLLFFFFSLIFIIDLEHREILYFVSVVGLVICVAGGIWLHRSVVNIQLLSTRPLINGIVNTALGIAVGAAIMFALYLLGLLFSWIVSRIRNEKLSEVALGFGDVIVAGMLGALLGYPGIIGSLIIAILLGGFFSLVYLILMKIKGRFQALTAIPYAPFLLISAMVLLYFAK